MYAEIRDCVQIRFAKVILLVKLPFKYRVFTMVYVEEHPE